MPQARYRLVDTDTTPYYHCASRCVRRAFLCGRDKYAGKNFDYRKQWILDRVKKLSAVFAVEVCSYAIMANHYHLILYIDSDQAEQWSMDTVIERWTSLFAGTPLAQQYLAGEPLSQSEHSTLAVLEKIWRQRLRDLSWFMRCLNEHIARLANAEDDCTGRFWEGRFKSQALLNEAALCACMAYVDLNPIRAGLCETLEASDFTSIQERLSTLWEERHPAKKISTQTTDTSWLKPLREQTDLPSKSVIPIERTSYFMLVDWTGRRVRSDKKGTIPNHIAPILDRLNIDKENWTTNVQHFGNRFYRALGRVNQIRSLAKKWNMSWLKGLGPASTFYT